MAPDSSGPGPILLFDGECGFCRRVVVFTRRRDRRARFRFEPLGSDAGRALLARHSIGADPDSVVLIADGRVHLKSSAGLHMLRMLGWPWKAAYLLIGLPVRLRDAVYDVVARWRRGL